jgi:hypothetical protein
MTGFHEWVYARFGYTWHDLVDEREVEADVADGVALQARRGRRG